METAKDRQWKRVKSALPLSPPTYYQVGIILISETAEFSNFSSRKSLHFFLFPEEWKCKTVISVFSTAICFQGLQAILKQNKSSCRKSLLYPADIRVGQNSSDRTALGEQMPIWKNLNTPEKHIDCVKILMTFTGNLPSFMSAHLPTSSANISTLTMKIKCKNKVKIKKKKEDQN